MKLNVKITFLTIELIFVKGILLRYDRGDRMLKNLMFISILKGRRYKEVKMKLLMSQHLSSVLQLIY